MFLKILTPFIFILNVTLAVIVTVAASVPIILAGIIKGIFPFESFWHSISKFSDLMMLMWCRGLSLIMCLNVQLKWNIEGIGELSKNNWYLLVSNHKSWTDIIVLCVLFRNHIPMNKYFLKQQLAWIPFVGLACWALDMPFMRRYSRDFLLKHPELRGKDIETTRRSCEKFRLRPTTIVNFVEGSRFTEAKRIKTNSPYNNLLPPKAAGIAFTLNALGEQFDRILNVTIYYPDNNKNPFIDLLLGKMKRLAVRVETIPITEDIRGDYFNDKSYKRKFHLWLNDIWLKKDNLLDKLKVHFTT